MENKKYQILQSKSIEILQEYVNKAIDNGYVVSGGINVTNAPEGIVFYTQTIVLKGYENGK